MVLQREVDSLRGDNVKLYEKIKFLQSYPGTVCAIDIVSGGRGERSEIKMIRQFMYLCIPLYGP